jgi:hypothetical protein
VGDVVSVSTIATSGVELLDAEKIALIYGSKGKAGKDSFFEAYVKEVLGEYLVAERRAKWEFHLTLISTQSTSSMSPSIISSKSRTTA